MQNYNRLMEGVIADLKKNKKRPKLLLHSCCAPCSSACIERLKDAFDLTVYYYNPNIDTISEYNARKEEQQRLCKELQINCIVEDHLQADFYTAVNGKEDLPEGGARCTICYELRLKKTAKKAIELGYEYFATTLTVSPLKDADRLNSIGERIQEELSIKYLPSDFKKKGGYQRSIELSREYNLYRQNYCGCEFSKIIKPQD